jgi:GAF domain-containing protein
VPDVPDRGGVGAGRRSEPDADAPRDPTDLGASPEQPAADPGESQQYRLLLEINNAIIANLTRESLFRAITEALREIVPFDRAVLYDAENDVLRTFALEGPNLSGHFHDLHRDITRQSTAAGWGLEHRQSRLRRDIEAEARLPGDEIMLAGGVRAYLCVPLMARGQAIGALLLQSFAPNRYLPEDVPLLEEVAKQIAGY